MINEACGHLQAASCLTREGCCSVEEVNSGGPPLKAGRETLFRFHRCHCLIEGQRVGLGPWIGDEGTLHGNIYGYI